MARLGDPLTCMRDEHEMHGIENDCDSNLHRVLKSHIETNKAPRLTNVFTNHESRLYSVTPIWVRYVSAKEHCSTYEVHESLEKANTMKDRADDYPN